MEVMDFSGERGRNGGRGVVWWLMVEEVVEVRMMVGDSKFELRRKRNWGKFWVEMVDEGGGVGE